LFLEWLTIYGAEKIILGADCINRKIATHGWLESSEIEVVDFINEYKKKGVNYVICTDIAKDGMLQGTSNELYTEILSKTKIALIASGGVSSMADLVKLKEMKCEGLSLVKLFMRKKLL